MFRGRFDVRERERRPAWIAFITLFGVMAGHALLETARDALFLSKLPATHLPAVYIGVAVLAAAISRLEPRFRPADCAVALSRTLLAAAAVTAAFWPLLASSEAWVLYALYLWSATVASLAVAGFWLMTSERFTVSQAKRLYPLIGTGSVLGAVAGTAVASVVATLFPARQLLLVAAASFLVAAMGPKVFTQGAARVTRATPDTRPLSPRDLFEGRYVRRVAALVGVATIAFTLADYVFKSAVAAHVPQSELGAFFGATYLGLNVLSLLVQLALVRPIVRWTGVTGALVVMPVLLFGGAAAVVVSGGLVAALALKAADGGLRYSLHRTATELLFVPMGDRLRTAAKTAIDVVVSRGGQAVASLVILGGIAVEATLAHLGILVAALALAFAALALRLRPHYLDVFRQTLRESAGQTRLAYPELDLSSLESVIATLNSQNDLEVTAAMDYLAEEGRARLIPALILYHPSPLVVEHALAIFADARREDFLPFVDRLLSHEQPSVRAAALRAQCAVAPDRKKLEHHLDSDCGALAATALVGVISAGWLDDDTAETRLETVLRDGRAEVRLALAEAVAASPNFAFESTLVRLANDVSMDVRRAAIRGMAAIPSVRFLPSLEQMLAQRELRAEARSTLVGLGDMALTYLAGALADDERPLAIRRHLPRTIMRFDPRAAARTLLEQLPVEKDGVVRYKLLRALGRLHADHPDIPLDQDVLRDLIRRTLERMVVLLEWRMVLQRGAASSATRRTAAHDLLVSLLADKEENGVERLFRLLGLAYPGENLATIYRGLGSPSPKVRASSRELLEHLLDSPLREAVLGLVDDGDDDERLNQLAQFRPKSAKLDYEGVLRELLHVSSESLRSLAAYHVGELGLRELEGDLEALADEGRGFLPDVVEHALESMRTPNRPLVEA